MSRPKTTWFVVNGDAELMDGLCLDPEEEAPKHGFNTKNKAVAFAQKHAKQYPDEEFFVVERKPVVRVGRWSRTWTRIE